MLNECYTDDYSTVRCVEHEADVIASGPVCVTYAAKATGQKPDAFSAGRTNSEMAYEWQNR